MELLDSDTSNCYLHCDQDIDCIIKKISHKTNSPSLQFNLMQNCRRCDGKDCPELNMI